MYKDDYYELVIGYFIVYYIDQNKTYEERVSNEEFAENFQSNESIEDVAINNVSEQQVKEYLKKTLSASQYKIAYDLIFNDFKQTEIAKQQGISKQAINRKVHFIRNKIKKSKRC